MSENETTSVCGVQYAGIRGNRGSMLVGLLMSLAVLGILAVAIWPVFRPQFDGAKRINMALSAAMTRANIWSQVKVSAAWDATMAHACNQANFACLQANNCTAPAEPGKPFTCLVNSAGTVIFDSNNASAGFDDTGEPCSQYSATSPSGTCVFRPKLAWDCMTAGCTGSPKFKIMISFDYSGPGSAMNMQSYTIVEKK